MRGIHSTSEQRAWLRSLSAYAQFTFGRPVNPLQCATCGKLAVTGLTTWKIDPQGLCPRCRSIRTPNHDTIHLFRPMRMTK